MNETVKDIIADRNQLMAEVEKLKAECARAELRVKDLVATWAKVSNAYGARHPVHAIDMAQHYALQEMHAALAASPDSDERLREVMLSGALRSVERAKQARVADPQTWVSKREIEAIIDEVLGVKP